jgi:hypothetical protein
MTTIALPELQLKEDNTSQYLHFLKYNSLGMGSTSEGIGFVSCSQMGLLVGFVSPSLVTTVVSKLTSCPQTTWFTCNTKKRMN